MATPEQIHEFVTCTQAALKRATDRINELEAEKKGHATKIASIAKSLVTNSLIAPAQEAAAQQTMSTFGGTLDLMSKLAANTTLKSRAQSPAPLGAPEPSRKEASHSRHSGNPKLMTGEADDILTRNLLNRRTR